MDDLIVSASGSLWPIFFSEMIFSYIEVFTPTLADYQY